MVILTLSLHLLTPKSGATRHYINDVTLTLRITINGLLLKMLRMLGCLFLFGVFFVVVVVAFVVVVFVVVIFVVVIFVVVIFVVMCC